MVDQGSGYTLDEALCGIGFGKFQGCVFAYAGLGCIVEAMEVMILSFVGPSVKSEWNLSSTEESLITTVVFAGMLIGAYSWGLISDNYGRRKGLLSIAVVTSGAAFLSAFSPNYISLVILRWIVGIGLGGGPVYNSWFLEFVPSPNRGAWMVIFANFWTFGMIIEASLAWILMPKLGWRWLLALSSLPAFLALLFYSLVPESPRYLCMKGRTADAHNLLKIAAAINKTELPPGILLSDHRVDEEQASVEDLRLLLPERKIKVDNTGISNLRILLSSALIKTTLLLWVVFFANAFSYYGIILLTSELTSGRSESSTVSLHSNDANNSSYRDVFITSLAELPGLVFSAFIVDRIGRKYSMQLMFLLGFIFLLPLVSHRNEILTTGLLFGARMFINGTYTVANIYAEEIYPTYVRTTGVGVANSIGRIGGMISPFVAVQLVATFNQTAAVLLFEVVILLSGLCVMFFPRETMARALT